MNRFSIITGISIYCIINYGLPPYSQNINAYFFYSIYRHLEFCDFFIHVIKIVSRSKSSKKVDIENLVQLKNLIGLFYFV